MKAITKNNNEFPESLKIIKKSPKILYYMGNIKLLKTNCIAIVGSRSCSDYGKELAEKFAYELAKKGVTIVSGLALRNRYKCTYRSTKSFAEKQQQFCGGGLKNIFPKENTELFKNIVKNKGLVITEYEEKCEAVSKNFPVRNRIVSGLSLGVLVVEAKYRSGASLTANIAKEQGKKVFCIPRNINEKNTRTNELIKQGAMLVTSSNEIIKECNIKENNIRQKKANIVKPIINTPKISKEYKEVYEKIPIDPINVEELYKKIKDSVSNINSTLTMLELEGLIEQLPGKNFKRRI